MLSCFSSTHYLLHTVSLFVTLLTIRNNTVLCKIVRHLVWFIPKRRRFIRMAFCPITPKYFLSSFRPLKYRRHVTEERRFPFFLFFFLSSVFSFFEFFATKDCASNKSNFRYSFDRIRENNSLLFLTGNSKFEVNSRQTCVFYIVNRIAYNRKYDMVCDR